MFDFIVTVVEEDKLGVALGQAGECGVGGVSKQIKQQVLLGVLLLSILVLVHQSFSIECSCVSFLTRPDRIGRFQLSFSHFGILRHRLEGRLDVGSVVALL